MRKLVCAIAAGALAFPGLASANHVAGATYNGTVSTGSGGTVTIVVAGDGQSLSFTASNIGNGSSCTGVSFGPVTDIPISNHSFSYLSNDGLISASGTFDSPGHAGGGAQVLTTPCTTGSQAWTATTLAAGPDARISRSTENTLVGDDIFNSTAEDQVRKWSAKRGQARQFHVDIQNDGTEAGDFSVKGCGTSRGFKVTYRYGGANVTSAVVAGDLDTNQLDPDEADTVFMTIKPTRKAKPGKVKSCKVTAERTTNDLVDAVKAELKVKRG